MSGTSLDGLDICFCELVHDGETWAYQINQATTIPYEEEWKSALKKAPELTGEQLSSLDNAYGVYCGQQVKRFMLVNGIYPEMIASHGHTVFHRPDLGYTLQIGKGSAIAGITGIMTICDFRSQDVTLGGQGAPLVPVGDRLLFGNYDLCLNIGGFSNISYDAGGHRIAYDISPANIVLNELAALEGRPYDAGGELAAGGRLIPGLLEDLNHLDYYRQSPPKSLGREWVNAFTDPVLDNYKHEPVRDLLRTFTGHIAYQIGRVIQNSGKRNVLVTGGGALNTFLIRSIREQCSADVVVADERLLQYKEALIFALLGVLRIRGEVNCLASVTGALHDHCSGCIYPGK